MLENENIKSVVIEGGDQVGKGDATMNLSRELIEQGYDVAQISFPCYATPTGYAIREILTEGFSKEMQIGQDEALSIKMGLFALNRLEVVNYLSTLENSSNTIYLFDRGPYSNALTIAYDLSLRRNRGDINIDSLVEKALDMDFYTIKMLNMSRCIVNLMTVNEEWSVMREKEDLHDQRDVQELSKAIYSNFQDRFGNSWRNIPTRINGSWRLREEILHDNYDFLANRLSLNPKNGRVGKKVDISIEKILKYPYGYSISRSLSCSFEKALKENCKKDLYGYGEEISRYVVSNTENIKWSNPEISSAVRNILGYSSNFDKVLNYIYGNDFGTKFINSV